MCVVVPLGVFLLPSVFQIGGQNWLVSIVCFSNLVVVLTYICESIIYFIYSTSWCLLFNCHSILLTYSAILLTYSTIHVAYYCGTSIVTCLKKAFYWHTIFLTHNTEITYYWYTMFIIAFYWHSTDVYYSHTKLLTYSTGITYYWCTMLLKYSSTAEILYYMCNKLLTYRTIDIPHYVLTDTTYYWHATLLS